MKKEKRKKKTANTQSKGYLRPISNLYPIKVASEQGLVSNVIEIKQWYLIVKDCNSDLLAEAEEQQWQ